MKRPSPVDAGLLTITLVVGMKPWTWLLLYIAFRPLNVYVFFCCFGKFLNPTLKPEAPEVLLPIPSSPLLRDALFFRLCVSFRYCNGETQLLGNVEPTDFFYLLNVLPVLKPSVSFVLSSSKREWDTSFSCDWYLLFNFGFSGNVSFEASVFSYFATAESILNLCAFERSYCL